MTEVVIHFNKTPHPVFGPSAPANQLIIRIQPDEGIVMNFWFEASGAGFVAKEVSMDFSLPGSGRLKLLTAYERLLLDAMNGDATLFARSECRHAGRLLSPFSPIRGRPAPSMGMLVVLGAQRGSRDAPAGSSKLALALSQSDEHGIIVSYSYS